MHDDNKLESNDGPEYRRPDDIAFSEMLDALGSLSLFNADPNFRNQAFNLALIDKFVMDHELQLLRRQFDEERTPAVETAFVSAQSQMWIFAAYELMRTWRQRARDIIKWSDNGGLEAKLAHLKRPTPFVHFGRESRARQIERVLAHPALTQNLREDLRRTHIPFVRMETVRVSIAKHEVRGQKNSVAMMPTLGLINRWCGSLDFEIERDGAILDTISRRDIADDLRAIPNLVLPTDDEIKSFDEFMRGPADDLDWSVSQNIEDT
jgi:hypothetical protein